VPFLSNDSSRYSHCTGAPEEDKAIAEGRMQEPERDTISTEDYCRRALRCYEAGADGVHIFNNYNDPGIEILRLLGDPDECRQIVDRASG